MTHALLLFVVTVGMGGQARTIALQPHNPVTLQINRGDAIRLQGDLDKIQVFRRWLGSAGGYVDVSHPADAPLISSPFGQTAFRLEAKGEASAAFTLQTTTSRRSQRAWRHLERDLVDWLHQGALAPVPTPASASDAIRAGFEALQFLATALRDIDIEAKQADALLRAQIELLLSQAHPDWNPPTQSEDLVVGDALHENNRRFGVVSAGETAEWSFGRPGSVRLQIESRYATDCAQGWFEVGTRPRQWLRIGCTAGERIRPLDVVAGVFPGHRVRLQADTGQWLVRTTFHSHRPRMSWLWTRQATDVLSMLADAEGLVGAEAHRLLGHANIAVERYRQVATEAPDGSFLLRYVRWRAAKYHKQPSDVADALMRVLTTPCDGNEPCLALMARAGADALGALLSVGDDDDAKSLAMLLASEGFPLPSPLVARLGTASNVDAMLHLYHRDLQAQPTRLDLLASMGHYLQHDATWKPLALRGNGTEAFMEALTAQENNDGALVSITERGADLEIPEDPLQMGRRRRIQIVAQAKAQEAFAQFQLNDQAYALAMDQAVVATSLTLAPGQYAIRTLQGQLWVTDLRPAQETQHRKKLRHYWRFEAEVPLIARLPTTPWSVPVGVGIQTRNPATCTQPEVFELCFDDERCHRVRTQPQAAGLQTYLWTPPNARTIRLHKPNPSLCKLFVRAWVAAPRPLPAPSLPNAAHLQAAANTSQEDQVAALRLVDQHLSASPDAPDLLNERGRILLARGQFDEARSALQKAAPRHAEASQWLQALGASDAWDAGMHEAARDGPDAIANERHADNAVQTSDPRLQLQPQPDERPCLAARILHARQTPSLVPETITTTEACLSPPQSAYAQFLAARWKARTALEEAAEALQKLALETPSAASGLQATAAAWQQRSRSPEMAILAYANAMDEGQEALTSAARKRAETVARWTWLSSVQSSAGRTSVQAGGRVTDTHAATQQNPVTFVIHGPTVVRLRLRRLGGPGAASAIVVRDNGSEVATTEFAKGVALVAKLKRQGRRAYGAAVRLDIPFRHFGRHKVVVHPNRGEAFVQAAVLVPIAGETVDAPQEPQSSGETAAMAPWFLHITPPRALHEVHASGERAPRGPFSVELTTGMVDQARDEGPPTVAVGRHVPIDVQLRRRMLPSLWLSLQSLTLVQGDTAPTLGGGARLDFGHGPGIRAHLHIDATTQSPSDTTLFHLRLRSAVGWVLEPLPNLHVDGEVTYFARHLGGDPPASNAQAINPRVFSAYKRTHPRGAHARAQVKYSPLADLVVSLRAKAVTNTELHSLDHLRFRADMAALLGPLFTRVGVNHERWLSDDDRPQATSNNALSATIGARLWTGQGLLWTLQVADRFFLKPREHFFSVGIGVQYSFERRLNDVPPKALEFHKMYEQREPAPRDPVAAR